MQVGNSDPVLPSPGFASNQFSGNCGPLDFSRRQHRAVLPQNHLRLLILISLLPFVCAKGGEQGRDLDFLFSFLCDGISP